MKHHLFGLVVILSMITVSCKTQHHSSSKTANAEQHLEIQQLQNQLKEKETTIAILEQQLTECKNNLSLYEFFNNEDISIFTNNDLEQNGQAQKLTGSSKTKYETIRMIAEADSKITILNNKIEQIQNQQQEMRWSQKELENAIALQIKADLYSIGDLLANIRKRDLSFLSTAQMEYYSKQKQRYNVIFNKY